jgi:L-malate glycosyltransferase
MDFIKFHRDLSKNEKVPFFIRAPILILSSWLFQGILYMDATEQIFKIIFDTVLFSLIFLGLKILINDQFIILFALIIGHSIDWVINGQIFVLLKNLKLINTDMTHFKNYMAQLGQKTERLGSIEAVAAFGSISRGTLKKSSDLDIRIIRKKGLVNAMITYMFIISCRTFAFLNKFPLDIYMLDDIKTISRHIENEDPLVIYDPNNLFNPT